ncbi:ectoine/hydroxyectoine ABC transporter substrate-binding protein EhuB [Virgibacillus xinjiangensis]|uniref:Ectoine/hydroxyectoine ABC transporter substrate-binding protein EhuB n=1 Tax=Virgibacillus xinjiangensis TaxID=393090 RepID=A0ABV7CSJ3_9BACI
MKKLLSTSFLVLMILLLAACGSGNESSGGNGNGGSESDGSKLEQLQEAGTVTIGFANEAPYAYEDNGELKGASVDIAKAVFEELGIDNMESQLSDFSQLIPGLQAGQFDVVTAGMAIQPGRCENAAFSEPTMQYGEGLIVQAGNPLGLESYEDIADNPDATVVVMEGATENEFLRSEGVSDDQIQTASDIPATFSAVESGRADATTGTEMTVKMALESADTDGLEFVESFEQPDIEGVPSYGAAAFSLENTELRDAYNEVLQQLKEDGTVAELLEANGFSEESNMVEPGEVTTEAICNGEV